jgi:hypothetical protein
MKAFVDHYISTGQVAAVERCLLHLNSRTMDLDLTIRLCLQYNLFSALVYILNNGTNDYTTPIDILLVYSLDIKAGLMKSLMKRAAQAPADMMTPSLSGDGAMTMRLVGTPDERRALGLKLLLYIQVRVLWFDELISSLSLAPFSFLYLAVRATRPVVPSG